MPTNDNDSATSGPIPFTPDPHGRAALLLVESLIHGLCENGGLRVRQAVEIAERAVNVQFDQAEAADGAGAPLWQSHELLEAIAASLRADGGDDIPPAPPRLVR